MRKPKLKLQLRCSPTGVVSMICLTEQSPITLVIAELDENGEPDIESLAIAHDRLIDLSLATHDERYDALALEMTETLRDRVFAEVVRHGPFAEVVRHGPNARYARHLLGYEELEAACIGFDVMNARA